MKTKAIEEGRKMSCKGEILPFKILMLVSLGFIIFSFNSCYVVPWHGEDGRPGNAYVALTWVDAEPEYIDAGSSGIPPVFYWDEYYPAYPGYYSLYYEGSIWNGFNKSLYAWEVNYEIWRIPGEEGGMYYHGADGADTYFTLECSPFGPYVYEDIYKDQSLTNEVTPNMFTIEGYENGFGFKATYKKVEPGSYQK